MEMKKKLMLGALAGLWLSANASAQWLTPAEMGSGAPPPQIVERYEDGDERMLVLDRGRTQAKLAKCLHERLPGYPTQALQVLAENVAGQVLREFNGAVYVPAIFLIPECASSTFQEYLDKSDVPTAGQWLQMNRGRQ